MENRGSNYRNWLALFMKEEDSCGYYSKERGRGKTRKSSLMSEYSLNVDYVTVIQFLMARKGSRICPSFDHANVVIMTRGKGDGIWHQTLLSLLLSNRDSLILIYTVLYNIQSTKFSCILHFKFHLFPYVIKPLFGFFTPLKWPCLHWLNKPSEKS